MLDFSGLELNTSEPVYLQIAAYVKRQIFTGAAEQGNPLPSRRELAAMLKINPNTVQKAVRLMEEEGFVTTPKNSVSILQWSSSVFSEIQKEMTAGFAADFVKHAKENGLTLEEVSHLLQQEWEKGEY